jgi:disulfide bond formation protein DsbB
MPRSRRTGFTTVFLILWLVLWIAGMLVVLYTALAALGRSDLAAVGVMGVWLAAAGTGLYIALRKLRLRMMPGIESPRQRPAHLWRDAPPAPAHAADADGSHAPSR